MKNVKLINEALKKCQQSVRLVVTSLLTSLYDTTIDGLNKGVTLSMQTLSEEALSNIKRSNIKLSSYFELQKRFINDNVPTYSDLILGLPGETYESFVEGLCKLVESGQHNRIQFNNLSILVTQIKVNCTKTS